MTKPINAHGKIQGSGLPEFSREFGSEFSRPREVRRHVEPSDSTGEQSVVHVPRGLRD